uniref:Uncharacterized protein n=1 Tax=Rhizophora mucronata TaxID=61149 RepID=A0A2P2QV93_RHIMU
MMSLLWLICDSFCSPCNCRTPLVLEDVVQEEKCVAICFRSFRLDGLFYFYIISILYPFGI